MARYIGYLLVLLGLAAATIGFGLVAMQPQAELAMAPAPPRVDARPDPGAGRAPASADTPETIEPAPVVVAPRPSVVVPRRYRVIRRSDGSESIVTTDGNREIIQPATPTVRQESRLEIARRLAESLRPASLAFNAPERLRLDESTTLELVVAPGGAQDQARGLLSEGLSGGIVTEASAYSMTMEARLSGEDFEVSNPVQRKLVLPNQPTKWTWVVKPTATGEKKRLTLEVNAILDDGTRELAPFSVQTFNRDIIVEVTLVQRLLGTLKTADTVIAAFSGIGGVVMAAIGWLMARRRRTGE